MEKGRGDNEKGETDMKQSTQVEARLEAFGECRGWAVRGSIADNELRIRIDELLWMLEKTR